MKKFIFKTSLITGLLCAMSFALPTGVTMKAFYNHSKANFNRVKTIWMEEVPGLPQHFWVLGQYGLLFSLYPDDYDISSMVPNTSDSYTKSTLLDFHSKVHPSISSEYGAWNVSFHPNFKENKKFYIIYMHRRADGNTNAKTGGVVTVDEYIASGEKYSTVTFSRKIWEYNHNPSYGVSCMTFGPDGYLYIANCDYGSDSYDLTHFGRKILRIDVDNKANGQEYAIPADNPFVSSTDATIKKEIWSYGIRNVWGIHFDPLSGQLFTGEIGQNMYEELNVIVKGANGGWANMGDGEPQFYGYGFSGPCDPALRDCSKFEDPYYAFGRIGDLGMASIVGGRTFMGAKDSPFYGQHIFVDTESGKIFGTDPNKRVTYNWTPFPIVNLSKWIWYNENIPNSNIMRFFRKKVTVPAGKTVTTAYAAIVADDGFQAGLYINGKLMNNDAFGYGSAWTKWDFAPELKTGENLIAIIGRNFYDFSTAGLLFAMEITFNDGTKDTVVSDASWKANNTPPVRWEFLDYNDAGWPNAKELANYGDDPWGKLPGEMDLTIAGTPPQLIGQSDESLSRNNDGHDGIVYIGKDTFGYLYGVYVSWKVGADYHEIYRFDHADMRPAKAGCTDPKYAGFDSLAGIHVQDSCGAINPITRMEQAHQAGQSMIANLEGIQKAILPEDVVGIELYNMRGKKVWTYSRTDQKTRNYVILPQNLEKGVLQVKYLW
ncbi:MAG: PQQ-dependent sugar dehydrogenase [Fibrobacteria bacterium]|nr:PQQ-dependent sugar dehydrogenase [Fibrobacteria bacterium]